MQSYCITKRNQVYTRPFEIHLGRTLYLSWCSIAQWLRAAFGLETIYSPSIAFWINHSSAPYKWSVVFFSFRHDNRLRHGGPNRLRMRGGPLRSVHCNSEHWRDKLIFYSSSRVLYDYLRSGRLFEVFRSRWPVGRHFQETAFHCHRVLVLALHHSFRFGFCPFLYNFGMPHAIFELRNLWAPLQSTTGVEGFARFSKTIIGAGQILSLTDTMGDLILIYRCWVLWSKNYWVIIFPCLSLIGNLSES